MSTRKMTLIQYMPFRFYISVANVRPQVRHAAAATDKIKTYRICSCASTKDSSKLSEPRLDLRDHFHLNAQLNLLRPL